MGFGNLDNSSISLSAFPPRINLKLDNVSVTPTLIEKLITNLDIWQGYLVLIVFQ